MLLPRPGQGTSHSAGGLLGVLEKDEGTSLYLWPAMCCSPNCSSTGTA